MMMINGAMVAAMIIDVGVEFVIKVLVLMVCVKAIRSKKF